MKSLKRLCSEICYEKGYNPLSWPADVYDDIRQEKFRKVIQVNENSDNWDDWVGWLEGINHVNQQKSYVQINLKNWYKGTIRMHSKHVISVSEIIKEQLLFYNYRIEPLLGLE